MTTTMGARRVVAAFAASACTAAMVWFGNGLNPWWPLLWFAPVPVLVFALRSSWWCATLAAGLGWMGGSFSLWHYFQALGMPLSVWLGIFAGAALVFALAVLLLRALGRRGAWWSAALGFAALWVSSEYIRNLTTPHGTAGSLAYSQLNFLPFLQLASITGPWGMSFVLLFFSATVSISLHLARSQPRQALRVAGAGVGLVALVLGFGAFRLTAPQAGARVAVGLMAQDRAGREAVADAGGPTAGLLREYAAAAEGLAARGARVIVLPEKVGVVTDGDVGDADGLFQGLAERTGATIVVGLIQVSGGTKYNRARVYAPGVAVRTYDKQHMLPPFESDLRPGTALTLMTKGGERWGVEICKDMDFTPLAREYGQAGAGMMLVPAWDFRLDRWWHGHIAVMRGVEDGFSVARASRDGNLTVSDDRGRILAETRSDSATVATLMAEAPAGHEATVFQALGDWFAWIAMGGLALSCWRAARRDR